MTSLSHRAAADPAQGAEVEDTRAMLAAALLTGMVLLMSVAYGFQYRADSAHPLGYFLPFSILYFLGAALLLVVAFRQTPWHVRSRRLPAALGLALTTAALAATLYFTDGHLPIPALPTIAVLLIVIPAAATFLGLGWAASIVLLLGVAVQTVLAHSTPLDVAAANMLPVIEAGCGKLLAGENPYLATYPGITSVPLMYLPGLLLPYCAPVAAGLDVRVLNVVLFVAIIGYAGWAFGFKRRPERLSLTLLPLLLSPIAAQMMVHGHVWLYWLMVLAFVHALATSRLLAAALLLGLMLGTRQMSFFLAVPAVAYLSTRIAPMALLRYGAVSVAVYLALMTPVMLTTPNWVDLFYLSATRVGAQSHLVYGNPMNQVSLSGLLTETGLAGLLQLLQAAVLLLTSAAFWIWRRQIDFPRALILLGFCYVLVIGLNTFLHRYFYVPGLMLLALGLVYAMIPLNAAHERHKAG